MDRLKDGLTALGCSAVLSLLFWWCMATGDASFRGLIVTREKNPVGFWFQQAVLGALALAGILSGVGLLLGFL
ncbi:MAG TPA: hypothetical protein VF459_20125 [Caulobacteraceae bacterium]